MYSIFEFPPYSIEVHDSLSSSNDRAIQISAAAHPLQPVILALEQTHGRGRYDRKWSFITGNLCASIIMEPSKLLPRLIPLALAAAIINDLERRTSAKVEYKWPNDVLIDGKKICGILPELGPNNKLIIGFGINICGSPENSTHIGAYAPIVKQVDLLKSVLKCFTEQKDLLMLGSQRLHVFLSSKLSGVGKVVSVSLNGQNKISGLAVGLDDDFNLLLDRGGALTMIAFGELMQ